MSALSSFRFPRVRGGFELKKLVEVTEGVGGAYGWTIGVYGEKGVVARRGLGRGLVSKIPRIS